MKKIYLLTVLLLLGVAVPQLYAGEALPYENTCDDLTTVVTENSGKKKWSVYNKEAFRLQPQNTKTAFDASLYFPEIDFEEGKTYVFEVTAKHLYSTTAGTFTLNFATGTTASTQESPAIATETALQAADYQTYYYYYTCTESKTRRVALHLTSPGACGYFYLTHFRIAESSPNLPDKPTAFTATGDESGTKLVNFSVTAPTQTVMGETLTSLTSLEIYGDGALIYLISNPTPGQTYTFSKMMSRTGSFSFIAVPVNADGEGSPAYADVTIGADIPDWDKASDYKGGGTRHAYLATFVPGVGVQLTLDSAKWSTVEGATYTVVRMPDNVKVAEAVASPNVLDTSFPMSSQVMYYYQLTINEPEATSATTVTSSMMSINNAIDYVVSFTDKVAYREFTYYDIDKNNSSWGTNNNGYLVCSNNDDMLVTPGVLLEAGKSYRVSTNIMSSSGAAVGMEIALGRSNHLDSLTQVVMPYITESSKAFVEHSAYFNATESGNAFFGIHSLNNNGQKNYFNLCLQDFRVVEVPGELPDAVQDFKVTFQSTTAGQISFVASPNDIAGNPLASLTSIDIYKDGELFTKISNPVIGQTYTFDITVESGVKNVYHAVPYNECGEGIAAELVVLLITPPYENEMSTNELMDGWTVIDGFNDGFSWSVYRGASRCYPGTSGMDEWLITPAIHLEAGMYYKTSFLTWATSADDDAVSLWIGKSPTAEGMTQCIISPYTMGTESTLVKEYFKVNETGEYYIGFHGVNPNGRTASDFYVKSFTLSDSINPKVPGPGNLVVTPDPNGELACTVDIILPTLDINGDPLESLTKAALYYDGTLISSQDVTLGGETAQVTVPDPTQGVHLFTLICYNEYGQGREYETTAFIGINRPSYPTNFVVTLTENDGEVTLTWNAPTTDYDGYDINPDLITYEIFEYTSNGEVQIADSLTELTYTYQAVPADTTQQFKRFGVRAWTSYGGSQGVLSDVRAVGKPYMIPWFESFTDMSTSYIFRNQTIGSGYAAWGYNKEDPSGVTPVDGDNGFAIMEAIFASAQAGLATGRIALDVKNPELVFYVMNRSEGSYVDNNVLAVQVRPTNGEWTEVASNTVQNWGGGQHGWQKAVIDLSDYAGQAVELMFVGTCVSNTYLNIDRLTIGTPCEVDMSLMGITLPEETYPGKPFPVAVAVKNNGTVDVENATLKLYRNDELYATTTLALPAGNQITVNFYDTISNMEMRNNRWFIYQAEVVVDDDCDMTDNKSEAKQLTMVDDVYPTVNNLTGDRQGGSVELSWEAPDVPTEPSVFFDDFESYDSWSNIETGIGKYTLLDMDKQPIAWFNGIDWPIAKYSKQSFFLLDFSDPCFEAAQAATPNAFEAHSGNKALGSMTNSTDEYVVDMLITPELCGQAQTVSFYAKRIGAYTESFSVMYSTTGRSYGDFISLGSYSTGSDETVIPNDSYARFEVEVPEGAKYFAINHLRYGGSMLLIDDMQYTPAGNERLVVEGYNVYRNGVLIAFVPADGSEPIIYYDNEPDDGSNTYSVTVVYNRGESDPVSINVDKTGVGELLANGLCKAYGVDGAIRIDGAQGKDVKVFAVNGAAIAQADGKQHMTIAADAGFYIVTIGNQSFKVVVK